MAGGGSRNTRTGLAREKLGLSLEELALLSSGLKDADRRSREVSSFGRCQHSANDGSIHSHCSRTAPNSAHAEAARKPWWSQKGGTGAPSRPSQRLSILTMVKEAQTLLREWVPYHLLLGAAHLYIVNNDCSTDASVYSGCSTLQPYIDAGSVTFVERNFQCRRVTRATLLGALTEELLRRSSSSAAEHQHLEREWVLEIDPDEYVVLPPRMRLPDFFDSLMRTHHRVDNIPLPWRIFGSSFRANRTREGALVANYRLRLPLALSLEGSVRLVERQKAKDQVHPFLFKEMVRLPALGDAGRCREPHGAHSHLCSFTFDWVSRSVQNRTSKKPSSFPLSLAAINGTEEQSPLPAAMADAFIHHYTFLSDEEWERKKARGRPRRGTKFARRQGDVDPLFSTIYDPTLVVRIGLLADSADHWSPHPSLAKECAASLRRSDGYFGDANNDPNHRSAPLAAARVALAAAREQHARIGAESSALWLLEQRWARGGHESRAPILAALSLSATAESAATAAAASRWLLARWNSTVRVRRVASEVIAEVVGAYPIECVRPSPSRTSATEGRGGMLPSSSCTGWTTLEDERV